MFPASITPVILADPDNDHVLACALAAQAELSLPAKLRSKSASAATIESVVSPITAATRIALLSGHKFPRESP